VKDNWNFDYWGITMDGNTTANGYAYYARYLPVVPRLQAMVLDGKYRDPNRFLNLTRDECAAHYGKSFITDVGAGFAVLSADRDESWNVSATQTLGRVDEGFGGMDPVSNDISCKFRENAHAVRDAGCILKQGGTANRRRLLGRDCRTKVSS
jgi:hypothetical protein